MKILPKKDGFTTYRMVHGFTLIELLVVITLIAILSAIGMTTYASVQKDARDARRKLDIDAIANAMEANYDNVTGKYKNFSTSLMANNSTTPSVPADPLKDTARCGTNNDKLCQYCGSNVVGPPTRSAITPDENAAGTCVTNGAKVADNVPAADTAFEVCATLENGDTRYYCRVNQR